MLKEELARKYAQNIIGSLPKNPNRNELLLMLMNSYMAGFDKLCLTKPIVQQMVDTKDFTGGKKNYKFRLEEVDSIATFDEQSITIMSEGEEYNGVWVKARFVNSSLKVDIFKGDKIHGLDYKGWTLNSFTLSLSSYDGFFILHLSDSNGYSTQIMKGRFYRNGEGWEASLLRGIRNFINVVENYENAIHAAAVLNMKRLPTKPFRSKKDFYDSRKLIIEDQIKVVKKAREYFRQKGKVFGDDLLKQCEFASQCIENSEIID